MVHLFRADRQRICHSPKLLAGTGLYKLSLFMSTIFNGIAKKKRRCSRCKLLLTITPVMIGTVVILPWQNSRRQHMMRQWITYLTLLFITVSATAQIFAPIDQTFAFKKRTELGRRLSFARPDSNKLLLLLDIGNAYLKSNAPDSALFYSGQAVDLARRLRRQDH